MDQLTLDGFQQDDLLMSRPSRTGQADIEYGKTASILTKATGFMNAYDFTLNPYSGCSFGCTYCYAAFFSRDREKINNWGYWVRVKENAVATLTRKFPPGSLDGKRIYMSSVTDPYQPVERKVKLTQRILAEFALRHKIKLVVQTRSPDVVRDIDYYKQIEKNGGRVQINMTVTTDDEEVRTTFEPFCPGNSRRLNAIAELSDQGLQTCVTMTPLIWLADPEMFAHELLATNCERFIVQPFHFTKGKFVAQTREGAFRLIAARMGYTVADPWKEEYMFLYQRWRNIIRQRLMDEIHVMLGEGKSGFAPPF